MSKKSSIIGIALSIAIILSSVLVFTFNTNATTPRMDDVVIEELPSVDSETDKYYGGDAYTGIQQAAAQTANNLIAVFGSLQNISGGIVTLNNNLENQAVAQASNMEALMRLVKLSAGLIILAIGLANLSKYLTAFMEEKKEEEVMAAELPAYGYPPQQIGGPQY